jgi:cobalt transporter subunit CbtB
MSVTTHNPVSVSHSATESRTAPALIAIALGLGLIYAVGLFGSTTVHNTAHDVRHAMAFPCH